MHYGHPPHKPSPDDLWIIGCSCGWNSGEITQQQVDDMGVPWWCPECSGKATHFVGFHPSERGVAHKMAWIKRPLEQKRETGKGPWED